MTKEDYFKYYIQGSDHYLIPKDVFNELFDEMKIWREEAKELKEQLEVGEEQYNDLVEEKENLQEQLSIKTLQLEEIKLSKRDYTQENILEMKLTLKENQQKEFIKWLKKGIETVKNTEFLDERIQRAGLVAYNRCLRKYKSIIGDDKE